MTRKIAYLVILLFLSVSASSAMADDAPPQWLQDAARQATPSYDIKDLPAVVLRNEETISVDSNGAVTRTLRFAVRILLREGRDEAIARAIYNTDTEKVRDLNAWLIRRAGAGKSFGKKDIIDVARVANDLYNEARVKLISAESESAEGDVFGFESVTEERNVFSQTEFLFQEDLPSLDSRLTVDLPAGWRAESVTFNHAKVEPAVNGSSYAWELRDLAPIKHEARSPGWSSLSPRVAVSFFPPQGSSAPIQTFGNWSDVARWMAELEDPQMTVDDALAAKAHALTDSLPGELDKIKAIGRYVQQVQYISVQVGIGRGGGYRPHPSTEVFAKSYGDCKDKANLMRAMLSVLKIPAFMVSITADDATYVRAEWPSPHQFNHCIIAIKVSDATIAPSVVTHAKLGRLLIFDPTDAYTQLGDLPEEEQGSLALIDHKESDSLLRMPVLLPEASRLERSVDIKLDPLGDINGTLTERTIGQSAVTERARLRRLSALQYNNVIEGWISRGATGAKTTKVSPQDDAQAGNFKLDVDFSARSYAQIMQDRLMVFKPAVIGRLEQLSFTDGIRTHPYVIDGAMYSETVNIKLPAGFDVDEIPDPAKLDTEFGSYEANYVVKGDTLTFTRSLRLNKSTVPADKYESVKNFFGRVRAVEQSQVVLVKK